MDRYKKFTLEDIWYTLVLYGKLRITWMLYNLIYIHILRQTHKDKSFKHMTYREWEKACFRYIFKELVGLDYDEFKKEEF